MVDISFIYHKSSWLLQYPVDLNRPLHQHQQPTISLLVDLCARKIVQDSSTTKRVVSIIPHELYYNLMKAALLLSKDRAIEVLICHWPWRCLSLQKLAPDLFDTVTVLYDDTYFADRMRTAVKYTTCLTHTFVECLKRRAPTKLCSLDLSGFPVAEVIVNYLSSHVMLVYNEERQRQIIGEYNRVTQHWPQEEKQLYHLDTTLPDDKFVIYLDAFVEANDTHMELCRALKTTRSDASQFKLCVRRLDLSSMQIARIVVLLEQVDPEHFTGVSLQYTALLKEEGLVLLSEVMGRLYNLTSLDLSCNNIMASKDPATCRLLSETLACLPRLSRLDLSNNRTEHKLRQLLKNVQRPLEYLRICACGVRESDLYYLAASHHASALRHLDISENWFGRKIPAVLVLLKSIAPTLQVLEMEDCDLEASDMDTMLALCPMLMCVRYWNIGYNNQLRSVLMLEHVENFAQMAQLQALQLSFPTDCFSSQQDENNILDKSQFSCNFLTRMGVLCERAGRPNIAVHIIGDGYV